MRHETFGNVRITIAYVANIDMPDRNFSTDAIQFNPSYKSVGGW